MTASFVVDGGVQSSPPREDERVVATFVSPLPPRASFSVVSVAIPDVNKVRRIGTHN